MTNHTDGEESDPETTDEDKEEVIDVDNDEGHVDRSASHSEADTSQVRDAKDLLALGGKTVRDGVIIDPRAIGASARGKGLCIPGGGIVSLPSDHIEVEDSSEEEVDQAAADHQEFILLYG
jgi:hypothetical protein